MGDFRTSPTDVDVQTVSITDDMGIKKRFQLFCSLLQFSLLISYTQCPSALSRIKSLSCVISVIVKESWIMRLQCQNVTLSDWTIIWLRSMPIIETIGFDIWMQRKYKKWFWARCFRTQQSDSGIRRSNREFCQTESEYLQQSEPIKIWYSSVVLLVMWSTLLRENALSGVSKPDLAAIKELMHRQDDW